MTHWLFSLIMAVALLSPLSPPQSSSAEPQRVRAKIGVQIKSGERIFSAKAREILKPDDLLRIFVHPEIKSFIYVIHDDQQTVLLLNATEQKQNVSTLALPSLQEFYQAEGNSSVEQFTIIISPQEIPELSAMVDADISPAKWREIEQRLSVMSRIDLTTENETPFTIAGNVRGPGRGPGRGATQDMGFINDLKIFSGNGLLVKKYEFQIKK